MEWLIDYATRNWLWDPNDPDYDDLSKISGALTVLSFQTGIKRLLLESAFKDQSAPSNAATIPGYKPGEVRVPVLSIFSDEVSSFRRRPSQEQVDRLSEIMGKQPRWWIDYQDPRTYRE